MSIAVCAPLPRRRPCTVGRYYRVCERGGTSPWRESIVMGPAAYPGQWRACKGHLAVAYVADDIGPRDRRSLPRFVVDRFNGDGKPAGRVSAEARQIVEDLPEVISAEEAHAALAKMRERAEQMRRVCEVHGVTEDEVEAVAEAMAPRKKNALALFSALAMAVTAGVDLGPDLRR